MAISPKVERLFAGLKTDYDFSGFTIEHFVEWLATEHCCRLFLIRRPMPPKLFGLWLTSSEPEEVQYFFVDSALPAFHAVHVALHEINHWLLGHDTWMVTPREVLHLMETLEEEEFTRYFFPGHGRALEGAEAEAAVEEAERDVETLALLIQEEVERHARWSDLTMRVSCNDGLRAFFDGLGVL